MTVQEICDYFKNVVYKGHPEYEIEPNVIDGSYHFYLTVHLGNGNSYCFLIIPDTTNKPFDQIIPTTDQLKEFEQNDLFPNCVLKKVIIVKKGEDGFEHRNYPPQHFDQD